MELHIIDLDNILHVGALSGRSLDWAVNNIPTGGIYQVLQRIRKINPFDNPNKKIIIVSDVKENIRKENYPHYKAQRGKYDNEAKKVQRKGIRLQKTLIMDMFQKCGIPVIEKRGYEADDIMFNILLSHIYAKGNPLFHETTSTLHTSDADWIGAMCLSPNNIFFDCTTTTSKLRNITDIYSYMGNFQRDPGMEYIDRILYGDTSDNYKGISQVLNTDITLGIKGSLEQYMRENPSGQYIWNSTWWKEYLTSYISDPAIAEVVVESVDLALPFYMEEIAMNPNIANYTPNWEPMKDFTKVLRIKILEKHLGNIGEYTDKLNDYLNRLKSAYMKDYSEVFEMYEGLIFDTSNSPISDEKVGRIFEDVYLKLVDTP